MGVIVKGGDLACGNLGQRRLGFSIRGPATLIRTTGNTIGSVALEAVAARRSPHDAAL